MNLKSLAVALSLTLCSANQVLAQPKNAQGSAGSPPLLDGKAFDDSFGKLPTNVTADSLSFNSQKRVFAYQGNVIVTQGDMRLTSKLLEGAYNELNQLQKLTAKGDVLITKQDIQASGQTAIYDAVASIITLTDNPQLSQNESILTADRIKIYLKENRSQAEGDVRVTFVNNPNNGLKSPALTGQAAGQTPAAATTAAATPAATPATTGSVATTPTPKPTATPTSSKSKTTSSKKASTKTSTKKK
jgi:lipopolysaccharide export system protein LptA